jgi:ribonuclease HI
MSITCVYTDGGCVLKNPSDVGGTWAWVAVESLFILGASPTAGGIDSTAKLVKYASGFIPNYLNVKLTNNVMEYVAVVYALEAMSDGWSGTVYSDSEITLGRVFGTWRNKGLEPRLIERKERALKRLGVVKGEHVDGHPTKKQLLSGIGKRGNPVSKWNVLADKLCNQESLKAQGVIDDTSDNILQY